MNVSEQCRIAAYKGEKCVKKLACFFDILIVVSIVLIALSRCNRVFTRGYRLHAGFVCATPTPCDSVKLGKEIERV